MNKQIKYLMILIVITSFFTSCNDDFLERYPLVNINDGSYWKSADDLRFYANGFYNTMLDRDNGWGSIGIYGHDADGGSDTQIGLNYNRRMNGENTLPSSGGGWAIGDWAQLRELNYFMDHYQKVTAPWDNIKAYVGEILFFRTLFYFNKLRSFGDIPYVTTVLHNKSEQLFESRMPRNQVVDSLMRDMDLAVEYLPERTSSYTGRLTKETAMLLQARIALYEGSWEKYHALKNTPFKVTGADGSKFIRKAAEVSGALMALAEANGKTALANVGVEWGYTNLFNQTNYSSNKEVLLWRQYDHSLGLGTQWAWYNWRGADRGITKRLIDSYLCMDGKPISVSPLYQEDTDLKTVVSNRDPRLKQTICVDDGKHIRWTNDNSFFQLPSFEVGTGEGSSVTGYQLYKGHGFEIGQQNSTATSVARIYFRYAEALLIYAEAKAELGEITQGDIDRTINALRRRVGMNEGLLDMNNITADPNWEFPTLSPLLNEIRRERKVELACEGYRIDDIFRWAAADELIVGYIPQGAVWEQWRNHPDAFPEFLTSWTALSVNAKGYIAPYANFPAVSATGYHFNLGRDYLLPLPAIELTVNHALKQNPGWE